MYVVDGPRLFRAQSWDISCTFEIEIGNRGPDEATDVVVFADVETETPGYISVNGIEMPQRRPIPAENSLFFGARLGIDMRTPVPYMITGHVEVNGERRLTFGGQLATFCPDDYVSP